MGDKNTTDFPVLATTFFASIRTLVANDPQIAQISQTSHNRAKRANVVYFPYRDMHMPIVLMLTRTCVLISARLTCGGVGHSALLNF